MNNKFDVAPSAMGFLERLKEDAKVASDRIITTQAIKTAKIAILLWLTNHGFKAIWIEQISSILDSKPGQLFLQLVIGFAFSYIPRFKNDSKSKILGKLLNNTYISIFGDLLDFN